MKFFSRQKLPQSQWIRLHDNSKYDDKENDGTLQANFSSYISHQSTVFDVKL